MPWSASRNKKLIGARDPFGIRPLVLGKLGDSWVLASETCALDIIGAEFVREVENGEVVVITREGIESHRFVPKYPARLCIFEYIYFARPDSIVGGRSVYEVRKEMGRQLAREAPADADIVVPIPDSGVPAAIGYSQESGLPFEYGIIRNHYVGRTFIEPEQRIRQLGVKLKHSANEFQVKGKRIVLIDDSVVRGTTSVKIVQMMREAGASEVHMRISSPPITHPDFYGIDTPDQDKLLAAHRTLEEMRAIHRRRLASPSSRSTASTRPWAMRAATTPIRNSPTIASPANIRRGSEIAKGRRSRSSSPSSPRSVDGTNASRIASRSSPAPRAASAAPSRRNSRKKARMCCCSPATARPWKRSTTRSGRAAARPRSFRSSSPTASPSTRSGPRSMSASAGSMCWSATPPFSGACLPSPISRRSIGSARFAINVTANWRLIRTLDPLLRRSDAGRVIFVTSGVARSARAYWAPYSVTKAALEALAKTYANETADSPIKVNLIDPGANRDAHACRGLSRRGPGDAGARRKMSPSASLPLAMPDFTETGQIVEA